MASETNESLLAQFKAKPLVSIGRLIFFALLMTQSGFFAAYPATYRDRNMASLCLLCTPALFYWSYWLKCTQASLPMIAIIFALAGDDLDKEMFLGPNTFKVILCLTPVLFLFLPNTASDLSGNEEYRQLAFRLTFQVTIDLFDAVEMLDIVLDESQKATETIPNPHGIPKEFGIVMVTLACFSFLLSLLQMAENKLDKGKVKQRRYLPIIRNLVQLVFVNFVFMVIRLVVFFKYKKEESIFIAKNGIAIYMSALEIYSIRRNRRSQVDQA